MNDVELKNATTFERMEAFIAGLQVDWKTEPPLVSLPAIVPPLAMKPIICTGYLDRWYECGQTITRAKTIVIAGYSFSVADEHFNDLIRKGNSEARLIVVDPTLVQSTTVASLECQRAGRLTFVKSKAENLDNAKIEALLRN